MSLNHFLHFRTYFSISMLFCLLFLLNTPGWGQDHEKQLTEKNDQAWWTTVRDRVGQVLAQQGRTELDIESPKWFEVPYNTIGRMPLIDTCMQKPLLMPEIALWLDDQITTGSDRLTDLLALAIKTSEQTDQPVFTQKPEAPLPDWYREVTAELDRTIVPQEVREAFQILLQAMISATQLREQAFHNLSQKEKDKLEQLLPAYFVRPTDYGESVRGYTSDVDDCIELIKLLMKVDFDSLFCGSRIMAVAADRARDILAAMSGFVLPGGFTQTLFRRDTPLGPVVIGGYEHSVYTEEYALLIELGGDDVYLNHPASTSLSGWAAAVHIDIQGNDTYRSHGYSQGAALCGTAVFMDLKGNDNYISGHYSQGAALCGTVLFYEGDGDDTYSGDLGVQCFALFGYAIFVEKAGADSYRCAANGQGSASTMGTALLVEEGGNDLYKAGDKYGFYFTWDSSCAQGAATGMRPWPPFEKLTVYGGVGFLHERQGNDVYHAYNIGQGGSYIFALGMLVDSDGDDMYSGKNYCRGVGVHLSAAAAIDRKGNDFYNGLYGQNGYSLDRSAGVFLDLQGDDTYRTSGGIGFSHKPRGFALFFDARGDDTYAGWSNNYGKADWPFGDDLYSTGFFFDAGGKDSYSLEEYHNDSTWAEGSYGYGEDSKLPVPSEFKPSSWRVQGEVMKPDLGGRSPAVAGIIRLLLSPSSFIRLSALQYAQSSTSDLLEAVSYVAVHGGWAQQEALVDIIHYLRIEKLLGNEIVFRLSPLLTSDSRDMRLLGLYAFRSASCDQKSIHSQIIDLALEDESYEVRGMACTTVGKLKGKFAVKALSKALQDSHWWVRRQAARALGEIADKKSLQPLLLALEADEAFQVRAWAAYSLGQLNNDLAIAALENALKDKAEFVRCQAARILLTVFSKKQGLEELITLLDWPNHPMRNDWVFQFLVDFTGKSLPAQSKQWQEWWQTVKASFDVENHNRLYKQLLDAAELKKTADKDQVIQAYRKIYQLRPEHAGAQAELADLLNSAAWDRAVQGKNLDQALLEAQESVSIQKSTNNLDTLAVIFFLLGDKQKAEETIQEARSLAPENQKHIFDERREEFRNGRPVLR